ncbi:hypothetical protein [Trujillonella endophytica]|uniref:Uncharacterized protein n=1 Tax=Trujillonella endophytica TaxID=673521 RepID=A0A1H8W586_9ACTN|nr:hypothetical protein [Trujillella endophytica]SEP22806.1 hypothetical protein SAMN05660991_04089 [Trujillella endophytica]
MWFWIAVGLVAWMLLAVLVAVVLGRGIRLADQRTAGTGADRTPVPALRPARRRIPLPPIGMALAGTAVALESIGFVLRLNGATGPTAHALSMDAPYSVPRLFVAAVFTVAAVAALSAASRIPGRRAWWLSVGLVAGVIAAVKTGSTVHAGAMSSLGDALGSAQAGVLSISIAGAVIATLAFISRAERRDRRRVLSCLAAYAFASVVLSGVSNVAPGQLAITATFLEESGEALAGVAFLVAVLVGVAPRLVLPASWPVRRQADAHTIEVATDPLRGQRGAGRSSASD